MGYEGLTKRLCAIRDLYGAQCDVEIIVKPRGFTGMFAPNGLHRRPYFAISLFDTPEKVLDDIEYRSDEYYRSHKKEVVSQLALAIVDNTARHGRCSASDLIRLGFSEHNVKALGAEAALEAGRISSLGPFILQETGTTEGE